MKIWRICLIVLGFFIGLGALGGGITMLWDTSGSLMGIEQLLQQIPFKSFLLPAMILLFCIALPQLILAIITMKRLPFAAWFAVICAALLLIWLAVEVFYIGFTVLACLFIFFGLLELLCALLYRGAVNGQKCIVSGGILR